MRTYIDVVFNPDMNPADFAEAMTAINMELLFGPHDFVIEWDTYTDFQRKFKPVLKVLKKFKVNYRLMTYDEGDETPGPLNVALFQ